MMAHTHNLSTCEADTNVNYHQLLSSNKKEAFLNKTWLILERDFQNFLLVLRKPCDAKCIYLQKSILIHVEMLIFIEETSQGY